MHRVCNLSICDHFGLSWFSKLPNQRPTTARAPLTSARDFSSSQTKKLLLIGYAQPLSRDPSVLETGLGYALGEQTKQM